MNELDSVGIDQSEAAVFSRCRREDPSRSGRVPAKGPLGDVEVMCPHVGQATPGELSVLPPGGVVTMFVDRAQVLVKRSSGGRAQPSIPGVVIHGLGKWPGRQVTSDRGITDADTNPADIADGSVPNEFRCSHEMSSEFRSLLTPDLKRDAAASGRIRDPSSFDDRPGQRLFAVDVDASAACFDGRDRVPVIGGADHDRVEIRFRKHSHSIVIRSAEFAAGIPLHSTHGGLQSDRMHLGDADQSDAGLLEKPIQEVSASYAVSKDPEPQGSFRIPKEGG